MLEDEEGRIWKVEWISYMQSGRRLKFTVGWPEFACAQNIQDGDLLILQVVSPTHFKLHIIPLGGNYSSQQFLGLLFFLVANFCVKVFMHFNEVFVSFSAC